MRLLLALLLFCVSLPAAAQQCDDTPDRDCDADGFSVAEGDCDDQDFAVNPNAIEACGDAIDNNCDGLFNEGCDTSAWQGRLSGGGACTGGENPEGSLALLLPFVWALGPRRRRR